MAAKSKLGQNFLRDPQAIQRISPLVVGFRPLRLSLDALAIQLDRPLQLSLLMQALRLLEQLVQVGGLLLEQLAQFGQHDWITQVARCSLIWAGGEPE